MSHLGAFPFSIKYLYWIFGGVNFPTDKTPKIKSLVNFLFFGLLIHSTVVPDPLYVIFTLPKSIVVP